MILNRLFVLVYLGSLVAGSVLFIYNFFEYIPNILYGLRAFFQCKSTIFSHIAKEVFNVGKVDIKIIYFQIILLCLSFISVFIRFSKNNLKE